LYAIPTESQASTLGYIKPVDASWDYPTEPVRPSLSFNQSFGNLIGQTFGTYPPTASLTNVQFSSTQTPKISPVDSLKLTCNLVNSKYSIPSNVLFTVSISSSLGSVLYADSLRIEVKAKYCIEQVAVIKLQSKC
jgi:hypothetical protein